MPLNKQQKLNVICCKLEIMESKYSITFLGNAVKVSLKSYSLIFLKYLTHFAGNKT